MRRSLALRWRGRDLAYYGLTALVGLLLHIGLMATPLHSAAASAVTLPHPLASALPQPVERVPHHAPASAGLAVPTSVPAQQPVPDCQLELAPPPAGPALALPTGLAPIIWATLMAATIIPAWLLDRPPRPLQLADPQALLQVFRT